jgi:hypothetical protein
MMQKLVQYGLLTVLAATLTWNVGPAGAQGFMVRPMTMRVNPLPRQTIELPLEINNTAIDGPRTIDLRLVELSQDDQGTWRLVEPGSKADLSGHQSSLQWTSLSEDSVSIAPQRPASIMVKLTPPPNARGAYFAGIVAETPMPANPVGVMIRTRFLIPLIIEIRGRTVREHIGVTDVGMTYRTDTGGAPTTNAAMTVINSGQTYSRVRGELTVERQNGQQWRVVTRVPIKERGIIPGVTLKLGADLERRLPSGPYRLRGELFVDGRRVTPLEKIIQFQGDPRATVAYDATLLLRPSVVDMKVVPGATRTTILSIENTSASPVKIEMGSRTPHSLIGVQMGKIVGSQLSAEPWTRIEPSSFTLRPNGRQNVRVISSVPKDGVDHPNYYADLVLDGTYPDGQSAGETFSTVHLDNMEIKSTVAGAIERASLSQADNGNDILQIQFANIGDVDIMPTASVSVASSEGALVASAILSGDNDALLPLGQRNFSGELDLAKLKPGDYTLMPAVRIGNKTSVSHKYVLSVKNEEYTGSDGKKIEVPSVSLSEPEKTAASAEGDVSMEAEKPVSLDKKADKN